MGLINFKMSASCSHSVIVAEMKMEFCEKANIFRILWTCKERSSKVVKKQLVLCFGFPFDCGQKKLLKLSIVQLIRFSNFLPFWFIQQNKICTIEALKHHF